MLLLCLYPFPASILSLYPISPPPSSPLFLPPFSYVPQKQDFGGKLLLIKWEEGHTLALNEVKRIGAFIGYDDFICHMGDWAHRPFEKVILSMEFEPPEREETVVGIPATNTMCNSSSSTFILPSSLSPSSGNSSSSSFAFSSSSSSSSTASNTSNQHDTEVIDSVIDVIPLKAKKEDLWYISSSVSQNTMDTNTAVVYIDRLLFFIKSEAMRRRSPLRPGALDNVRKDLISYIVNVRRVHERYRGFVDNLLVAIDDKIVYRLDHPEVDIMQEERERRKKRERVREEQKKKSLAKSMLHLS